MYLSSILQPQRTKSFITSREDSQGKVSLIYGHLQQEVHSNTHQHSYITNKYTSSRTQMKSENQQELLLRVRALCAQAFRKHLRTSIRIKHQQTIIIFSLLIQADSITHSMDTRITETHRQTQLLTVYQASDSNQHSYVPIEYTLAIENQKLYHQQGGFLG